jgi:hypothetical protein
MDRKQLGTALFVLAVATAGYLAGVGHSNPAAASPIIGHSPDTYVTQGQYGESLTVLDDEGWDGRPGGDLPL